jgi:hypothetical protein
LAFCSSNLQSRRPKGACGLAIAFEPRFLDEDAHTADRDFGRGSGRTAINEA